MYRTTKQFWERFDKLPNSTQELARKNFQLLKENQQHPSLKFKPIGRFWSVRVGIHYRALAVKDGGDFIWVWIGSHSDYDKLLR